MNIDNEGYRIALRKTMIDLRKFDISKADILNGKEILRTKSDMELLEILLDYDRLKGIEIEYEKIMTENIHLKLDDKNKNIQISILESKVQGLESLIVDFETKFRIANKVNLQMERLEIKGKITDLLNTVDKHYKKSLEIDSLDIDIIDKKDAVDELSSNSIDNRLIKFLNDRGVFREEDLSSEDQFNYRFLKNRKF